MCVIGYLVASRSTRSNGAGAADADPPASPPLDEGSENVLNLRSRRASRAPLLDLLCVCGREEREREREAKHTYTHGHIYDKYTLIYIYIHMHT